MWKVRDITGERFGRLRALEPTEKRNRGYVVWKCLCSCGTFCLVNGNDLRKGDTNSCGCYRREKVTKHGHTANGKRTKEYSAWSSMMERCYNKNSVAYKDYGGRGIKVCERWHDFRKYYKDVGQIPTGMTVDRFPDNNGDYEPVNVRFATWKEQANNRRPISSGSHKQFWFRAWCKIGMAQFASNNQRQFAREYGLTRSAIGRCLDGKLSRHKGWTFKRLST